jgi:hypothetical protein
LAIGIDAMEKESLRSLAGDEKGERRGRWEFGDGDPRGRGALLLFSGRKY